MKSVPSLQILCLTGVDPAALIAGSCAFEFCQTEIEQLGLPGLDDEDIRQLDALFLAQGEADY